jgi:DNA-binding transcriptional regulator LsrR (DeoR family)
MVPDDELRFMAQVASLYHERKLRQAEIGRRLNLSQATVSRLLRRAEQEGIVRITVQRPFGSFPELEAAIQERYALKGVVVAAASGDDPGRIVPSLGEAAAFYLETTVAEDEVIGVSSWSEALLATANAMHALRRPTRARVVQILGGVGNPNAASHATRLTLRLASLVNGEAVMLPAPGVVGSAAMRDVVLADPFVRETVALFDQVTLALVGIGPIEPSRMLAVSGNVFSEAELAGLRRAGAVGDMGLRFFDAWGRPVQSALDDRVIGATLQQLQRARRTVGIAGGRHKYEAIRAVLRGGWVHVLVTDQFTATRLAGEQEQVPPPTVAASRSGR